MCRKATYGYDQRVEFFGTNGLVKHDNHFPSQVQRWTGEAVQQADLPHSFFMTRYEDAYKNETKVRDASCRFVCVCSFLYGVDQAFLGGWMDPTLACKIQSFGGRSVSVLVGNCGCCRHRSQLLLPNVQLRSNFVKDEVLPGEKYLV